ncbi:uncharacterized protein LOC124199771 [Daphnia pulex]|uniref:XRN2-binding (XTBD) domain-containing protein n=1 Tax=Daphnia pulex TaxID=6669 RepID=E9G144_DAPPU|nr:uncharacterized protein LOC124199771 [Daphnia pulex]EFX86602.1 hypothetical protein DAPPUDRAFT_222017 [Daphnia pulex]|eukprot:EFX86602.1 hypothetical protein DAPPUDRAFT_222017 [Daphnia pulex]
MDGDWDIEKYKNKFEPEEQWELKKQFMETHKTLFSEDRVVCLAQVLVNMEILGTTYPLETMKTVNELSVDIVGEFRERQKTRLQRTFVGAAAAANAKFSRK